MSEQKPTVGRAVHFYGANLRWHNNMRNRTPGQERADHLHENHVGPFSAVVVATRAAPDRVDLRVDYPSPLWGSEQVSEIVTNVIRGNSDDPLPKGDRCYWVWPPRV